LGNPKEKKKRKTRISGPGKRKCPQGEKAGSKRELYGGCGKNEKGGGKGLSIQWWEVLGSGGKEKGEWDLEGKERDARSKPPT